MAYLDHAASTQVRPEVIARVAEVWATAGNQSSIHAAGRHAKKLVEMAREQVAAAFGAIPAEVVFLSGGTEADNFAIKGIYQLRQAADPARRLVVTTAIEHPAVRDTVRWLAAHEGAEIALLPVTKSGVVDLKAAAELLRSRASEIALISVMWANNELGTVQPIVELAQIAQELSIPMHSDAVQAAMYEDIRFDDLGLAALAVSGHKLGAPQGVGAMLLQRGYTPEPLLHGGGQERRIRSGTLPAGLIAGFGLACEMASQQREQLCAHAARLRSRIEQVVLAAFPDAFVNGAEAPRLPNVTNISLPGIDAQALLLALDSLGIATSAGSACAAGTSKPSDVLAALELDEEARRGSIRLSVGWSSTDADVDELAAALPLALTRSRYVAS